MIWNPNTRRYLTTIPELCYLFILIRYSSCYYRKICCPSTHLCILHIFIHHILKHKRYFQSAKINTQTQSEEWCMILRSLESNKQSHIYRVLKCKLEKRTIKKIYRLKYHILVAAVFNNIWKWFICLGNFFLFPRVLNTILRISTCIMKY